MAQNGPNLVVPVASRPDDEFKAIDEPPIEIIFKEISESERKEAEPEATEVPPEEPEEPEAPPKVEIKPNPNRESKIKRKATGFVKDPPPDDEGRKCCVLM
eukprot:symbB.v1.2.016442.t1/scaffold1248.1/size129000/6